MRVAVLALRNVAEGGAGEGGRLEGFQVDSAGAAAFDEAALRKVVQNLKLRNFGDEELTVGPGISGGPDSCKMRVY